MLSPSSIYKLKKEELQHELECRGLDPHGTVEENRKKLSQYLQKQRQTETSEAEQPAQLFLEVPKVTMATKNSEIPQANTSSMISQAPTIPSTICPMTWTTMTTPSLSAPISTPRAHIPNLLVTTAPVATMTKSTITQAKGGKIPITTSVPYTATPYCTMSNFTGETWTQPNPAHPTYQSYPHYYPYQIPKVLSDAEIMDMVRKWNIRFDQGQDPLEFLERVEEMAHCYDIPTTRMLTALPELLTRNALAWYRNSRNNWSSWNDFVDAFKTFFLPPRYKLKLADEIRARIQKPTEKAKDYLTAIQSLMRWQTSLSPEEKLERAYENLRPEYRLYIRRTDFTDFTDLTKATEEYEHIKAEEVRAQPTSATPTRRPNPPAQLAVNYTREDCCWRCGQRGHRQTQCHNTPVKFCSRCGRQGTLSRDCSCPRNETARSTQRLTTNNQLTRASQGNAYRVPAIQGDRAPAHQP